MILYQLVCGRGHEFEAWFRNSATFDTQHLAGDVECPHCGRVDVNKAIMAPNISTSKTRSDNDETDRLLSQSSLESQCNDDSASPLTSAENASEDRAREVASKILEAVNSIREHVEASCDYVGDDFPDEARSLHYGESEKKGIYGNASEKDVNELREEGIDFISLPGSSRKDN